MKYFINVLEPLLINKTWILTGTPHLHHKILVRNISKEKTYLSTEADSEFRYVFLFIITGFKYIYKIFH